MADAQKKKDEEYEKKRAEIMRKVAEARAAAAGGGAGAEKQPEKKERKFEAQPEARKFGTHNGITCDGCSVQPIVGYRWRCRMCKNHDLCDECYETFKGGKLLHANGRRNPVSMKLEHHEFYCLVRKH